MSKKTYQSSFFDKYLINMKSKFITTIAPIKTQMNVDIS